MCVGNHKHILFRMATKGMHKSTRRGLFLPFSSVAFGRFFFLFFRFPSPSTKPLECHSQIQTPEL
jgi:hypothetical protein